MLDVPEGASLITFGLLQTGRGQAWVDEIQLEIVDRAIPSTDLAAAARAQNGEHVHPVSAAERQQILTRRREAPRWPVNLDFERRP